MFDESYLLIKTIMRQPECGCKVELGWRLIEEITMASCPKCGNSKLSKNKITKLKRCKRCGPMPERPYGRRPERQEPADTAGAEAL